MKCESSLMKILTIEIKTSLYMLKIIKQKVQKIQMCGSVKIYSAPLFTFTTEYSDPVF